VSSISLNRHAAVDLTFFATHRHRLIMFVHSERNLSAPSELKQQTLEAIYSFHDALLARWPFLCRPRCSTCCTLNVNMTGLEGGYLLAHLQRQQEMDILLGVVRTRPDALPPLTTNQFAAACLRGREIAPAQDIGNPGSCPFLDKDRCRVYPARPFGCRALASLRDCRETGCADMPPLLHSMNSMLMQLIEHLDQGGIWGNMVEVLAWLSDPAARERSSAVRLRISCPCPGFLIPPEEKQEIDDLLAKLSP
jgi:Fe-S-cluster containining protein